MNPTQGPEDDFDVSSDWLTNPDVSGDEATSEKRGAEPRGPFAFMDDEFGDEAMRLDEPADRPPSDPQITAMNLEGRADAFLEEPDPITIDGSGVRPPSAPEIRVPGFGNDGPITLEGPAEQPPHSTPIEAPRPGGRSPKAGGARETVKPNPGGGGFLKTVVVAVGCLAAGASGVYFGLPLLKSEEAKPAGPNLGGGTLPSPPDADTKPPTASIATPYQAARAILKAGKIKEARERLEAMKKGGGSKYEIHTLEAEILQAEDAEAASDETGAVLPQRDPLVELVVAMQPIQGPALSSAERSQLLLAALKGALENASTDAEKAVAGHKLAGHYAKLAQTALPADLAAAESYLKSAGETNLAANQARKTANPDELAAGDDRLHAEQAKERITQAGGRIADLKKLAELDESLSNERTRLAAFADGLAKALDPKAKEVESPVKDETLANLNSSAKRLVEAKASADGDLERAKEETAAWVVFANGLKDPLDLTLDPVAKRMEWVAEVGAKIATLKQPRETLLAEIQNLSKTLRDERKKGEMLTMTNASLSKELGQARKDLSEESKATAAARRLVDQWVGFAARVSTPLGIAETPKAEADPKEWISGAEGRIGYLAQAAASPDQNAKRLALLEAGEKTWARFGKDVAEVAFYESMPDERWKSNPDEAMTAWLGGLTDAVKQVKQPNRVEGLQEKAERSYQLGVEAFRARNFAKATSLLTQAVETWPYDARFFYFKGLAAQFQQAGGVSPTRETAVAAAVADMKAGYKLERLQRPESREIGKALEPIQFITREWVELFRNPDRVADPVRSFAGPIVEAGTHPTLSASTSTPPCDVDAPARAW